MTGRNDNCLSTRSPERTYGPDTRRDGIHLLERGREQAALTSLLTSLGGRRAGIVTLTGRPGHAQNALLRWAARRARDGGLCVLHAQAAPAEREVRYGVIAQLMTSMAGQAEEGPTGVSLRELMEHRLPDPLPGLDGTLHFAQTMPTLLVIEDTQWLDPASLRWLHALVRRLTPDTPVAVLASGSGVSAKGRDWLSLLPASPVPSKQLVLRGLTERGVATVVETVCGAPGDQRFTSAAAAATEGNPAVLWDVLRQFTDQGHEPVAARLPELRAITAAVVGDHATRSLDGLPAEAVALLRALAVCGELISFPLVRALAGLRPVRGQEVRVMLEAAGLTVSGGTKTQVRHPVVKARVLEDMATDERAQLYSRAAELAHRAWANDEDVAEILLRTPPPGAPWVVGTLCESFAAALDAEDHGRAAAYLSRALREPLEPRERARLTLELAAAETMSAPLAGDRRLGELVRAGSGAPEGLRARAVDLGLARGDSDWARRAAAEALCEVRPGERDDLIALFWLADESRDDTEPMVPEVPVLPDRPSTPAQSGVRAWQLAVRGEDLATTRALARAALAGDGPDTPLMLPRLAACRALILTDDHEEAAAELDALLTVVRRDHRRAATARILTARAELSLRAGRFDAVERDIQAAERALPLSSRHPLIIPSLTALRIASAVEAGRLEYARSLAAASTPPGAEEGVPWSALLYAKARVAAVDGRWAEALELAKESGRRLLRRQWSNPALLCWRPQAAEACYALGDRAEAARLSLEELRLARRWGSASALGVAELWTVPMTGADGRPVIAAREAVRVLGDSPSRLAYAWALARLASCELEEGDSRAAARSLARLSPFTAAHPSGRLAAAVSGLTERLERPAGPVTPALPPEWTTLSEAEQRTATFAGRGYGNREIAELLAVSRRTVELRLSNTYRKLRITGREELCVLVRNMGERQNDAS
ncbi:LuxR family transcriptional regulator [Streptomyces sp. 35G-GA-8]|uniref:AAA family ATPase n=1 Tax=Streptomyces sp. 35G-GA-8 TaxID=2939434 RepID=UPI00201F886A|nr:LuxR family transcriptional regulator [Streptomyces sp. 35G-GA-8]MCL7377809.1 AAA family ATPase [Streptomyces sp. 35G-GA-8]